MRHCSRRLFLIGLAAAAAPLRANAAAASAEERLNLANKHLAWIEGAEALPKHRGKTEERIG